MSRITIGAVVALALLVAAVFYVMAFHLPRSELAGLQRRFDEARALLPTRWEVAEGITQSRDANILPVAARIDELHESLGRGPAIPDGGVLGDDLREFVSRRSEALMGLVELSHGSHAAPSTITAAQIDDFTRWLVLRAYVERDCLAAMIDAARFAQAAHVATLEANTATESIALRELEETLPRCTEASDPEARAAAAGAFERLSDQRSPPIRVVRAPSQLRMKLEMANAQLRERWFWGLEGSYSVAVSAIDADLERYEELLSPRRPRPGYWHGGHPEERREDLWSTLELRLFAAYLRAFGLTDEAAVHAIEGLEDPHTGRPLQIDEYYVFASDFEDPVNDARISRPQPHLDIPGDIDLSALRDYIGVPIPRELIQSAIRSATPAARRCYEQELRHDPNLSGRVVVELELSTVGTVERAEVRSGINTRMDECVLSAVRTVRVEVPEGARPTTVVYPFLFNPA